MGLVSEYRRTNKDGRIDQFVGSCFQVWGSGVCNSSLLPMFLNVLRIELEG